MSPLRSLLPLACACLAALSSCSGGSDGQPRNAVLVTMDTTRYDALSCYGAPPGVTPNLDRLAEEGIRYAQARTVSPITMPAHASMMTGLYPHRHTVENNSAHALPGSARTLAEAARDAGMQTAAFVAAVVLADDYGLDQGFDVYDQPVPPLVQTEVTYERRSAGEVADEAIAWLGRRDPERPFFLWVHLFDPHLPLRPQPRFLEQAGGNAYLGAVAEMDHAIGRILDALREKGVWDETVVLAVSDHGEGLGDHGEETHAFYLYDSTMRVPMILRRPDGERAGEVSEEIVSVVDVYPTLGEALGLGISHDMDGASLWSARAPEDRNVYMESYLGYYTFGWSPLAGVVDRAGKYLHSSAPEFYDVWNDPEELRNLLEEGGPDVSPYLAHIEEVALRSPLTRSDRDRPEGDMAERVRQMQDLGYVGAVAGGDERPGPLEGFEGLAPHTRSDEQHTFLTAQQLVDGGDRKEAEPMLREILRENPRNASAWFLLSAVLIDEGEFEEAEAAARKGLERGGEWFGPHQNIGIALDGQGRHEEALEHYETAATLEPGLLVVVERIIDLLEKLGREDEVPRWRILQIEGREKKLEGRAR